MTIKGIFNLALKMGMEADLRRKEGVEKLLKRRREKYEKLPKEEKEEFDLEALENPYLDSRIHNISKDIEPKKVLIGIDIDSAGLLVAKELGVDLVIAHHPVGKGLAALSEVMDLQCDVLNLYGVPINVAEGLMKEKISEVARGVNVLNQQETVQTAKLLGINLINIHTPADNLAAKFLKNLVEKNKPERIEDLMKILKGVPEYKEAIKLGFGPEISTGGSERRCGRIAMTEITGGTEGSSKLYEKMAIAGIGTILSMHQSEEHRKEAEAANINVVIAGHISSDSLGMNIFLDELEKERIELIPCSGLIRISRI